MSEPSSAPPFARCPLSPGELDAYRLHLRRTPAALIGSNLTRRKGQSLEFREFVPYVPGNDVRHVDWRASARYRGADDLLVRHFEAEERLTLVISVDTRSTLWLPTWLPKQYIACWLAEALGWIALSENADLYLHDLFGVGAPVLLRGKRDRTRVAEAVAALIERSNAAPIAQTPGETINLQPLARILRPTTVWIVISDLYFADAQDEQFWSSNAGQLAQMMSTARDGLRWVMLVDLDSWHAEKAALGQGGFYIQAPGATSSLEPFQIEPETLRQIEQTIQRFKDQFLQRSLLPPLDYAHWQWPTDTPNAADFFRRRFADEQVLTRIFRRAL